MTQARFLSDLNLILVQAVFWISTGFVFGVSTFWPWWKSDLGWTIVPKVAAIGAILLPFVLNLEFGIDTSSLAWMWERTISFGLIGLIVIYRFAVLWVIQRYDMPAQLDDGAWYRWVSRVQMQGQDRR